MKFFRMILLVALFAFPQWGWAAHCTGLGLSPESFSELLGKTTQRVPEIRKARSIAEESGAVLAAYGGTSREIISYMCERIRAMGGTEAYRQWVNDPKTVIPLLDWHRIKSDLDFMLFPLDLEEDPKQVERAAREISNSLRGNIFYEKMDIQVADEFFRKFPVAAEHFEATSNIPISDRGIERLPQLEIDRGSHRVHMTDWGVEQYLSGKFDFALARVSKSRVDPYGEFRQVLRWIRYASEDPEMELTAASRKAIQSLLDEVLNRSRSEVIRYLQGQEGMKSEKILQALEKLQLYSGNSENTQKLIREFGIDQLAKAAGVLKQRILTPLPRLSPAARAKAIGKRKPIGAPIVLNHRTSLAAAQNISKGAIWQSDSQAIIGGKETKAALGPGLYAAPGAESLSYGDIYVQIELSPDAVAGVDFEQNGRFYVIKNRNAIRRIEPITYRQLFANALEKVRDQELLSTLPRNEKAALFRTVGALIDPMASREQEKIFREIFSIAKKVHDSTWYESRFDDEFLEAYLTRPGEIQTLLASDSAHAKQMIRKILLSEVLLSDSDHAQKLVEAYLLQANEIAKRHPEIAKWAKNALPELALRVRVQLLSNPRIRNVLDAKHRSWVRETLQDLLTAKERSGQQLHRHLQYSWDLNRPDDLAILKKALASAQQDVSKEAPSVRGGRNGLVKRPPRGRMGRRGGRMLRAKRGTRGGQGSGSATRWIFAGIERKNPALFLQHFPEMLSQTEEVTLSRKVSGVSKGITVIHRSKDFEPLSAALSNVQQGIDLTQEQSQLIEIYMRRGGVRLHVGLIHAGGPVQEMTKTYLMSGTRESLESLKSILELRSRPGGYFGPPQPLSPAERGAKSWATNLLANDAAFKKAVYEGLRKKPVPPLSLAVALLDPGDSKEEALLQQIARTGPKPELPRRALDSLARDYGVDPSEILESPEAYLERGATDDVDQIEVKRYIDEIELRRKFAARGGRAGSRCTPARALGRLLSDE